jgi:hypothetical protein
VDLSKGVAMRTTKRLAGALAVLMVTGALAGCGGGNAADTPVDAVPADSTTADTPAPTEDSPAPTTTEQAAPTSTAAPSGPAPCKSAGLKLALGPGEGAAGTVYRPLRFTNTGSTTCVLHGFPGVSYVGGENGAQVGKAADRVGEKGAAVSLKPGGVASAVVGFVNVHNFEEAACKPTPVKGLRVYPPGETVSMFVEAPGTGCAGTPPGTQLKVQTVVAGPGSG